MRRHRLRPGDDAVSPVVGVVLLVGIAVVLMSTIGVFVLGVGPGQQPPSGDIQFSQHPNGTSGGYDVNVTVTWADGLVADDVSTVVGSEEACQHPTAGSWSGALEAGDERTVFGYGPSCQPLEANDTIRVVWSPQGSSRTEVLAEHEVF